MVAKSHLMELTVSLQLIVAVFIPVLYAVDTALNSEIM